ncbi:MAG: Holliday junction resolvase RuvX [Deltaproteobacteria bacterium]|nr:Holliday junction resolvase RuvX [Deltaproteobacteria bacterium]
MSTFRDPRGRVAAIDLGKARVGLALSDELGLLAHPRPALDGSSLKGLLVALGHLARSEGVERFLVGLPLDLRGGEGVAAQRAMRFCQKLADETGCAVELVDERLTTVEATRRLKEQGKRRDEVRAGVDSASAAIVLQQWLDRRGLRRTSR